MEIADDLLSLPDFEPTETVFSLPVTGCIYAESGDGMLAVQSKWCLYFWGIVCALRMETSIDSDSLDTIKRVSFL